MNGIKYALKIVYVYLDTFSNWKISLETVTVSPTIFAIVTATVTITVTV